MTDVAITLRTCYLAGPMRGHEDFNFPAFHKQAAWLRANGWSVFSPAERDEQDEALNGDWAVTASKGLDYFMQYDLAAVCQTDAVVLLPGWETSQGARLESMVAVEVGHPVFEIVSGPNVFGGIYLGRKRLESVANERIAAEFIAGTRAYDALPTVQTTEPLVTATAWEFE